NFMTTTQRVLNLIWSGESGAAENENPPRFGIFCSSKHSRLRTEGECAAGSGRNFDEMTAAFHVCRDIRVVAHLFQTAVAFHSQMSWKVGYASKMMLVCRVECELARKFRDWND